MIVLPTSSEEYNTLAIFMREGAGMHPSLDARYVGWVVNDELMMAVGFNGFVGQTCQMHVAMVPGFKFTPKEMLRVCFKYPFHQLRLKRIVGIVNSKNEAAVKYDLHLGFKELLRMPGMHDDSGDLIVLYMDEKDCKWLTEPSGLVLPPQSSTAGSALTH